MLKGKNILVGVTGSIAAYKAAYLVRLLVKEGANVRVLMTPAAKHFISPLTMATLSGNPIFTEFFNPENGQWNSHVSLGLWADLFLVAPASANTISKMAYGIADNLLLTTYLSAKCPVMVAPAMDLDMYAHSATQESIEKLRSIGVGIVEAASGELASGLHGKGRMEEPEVIVGKIHDFFAALSTEAANKSPLAGRRVLITSGPTREAIDPVRFISNHSSGKMGSAIADELASRGADVVVVSGPAAVKPKSAAVQIVDVINAAQMYECTMEQYSKGCDVAVLCAAVADFTPVKTAECKMKKTGDMMTIELAPTKDIAAEIGKIKREGCFTVGFSLETDHARENAEGKLNKKNMDMIVLNTLEDAGAGFGHDTNKVTIIRRNGEAHSYPLQSKEEVASNIVDHIESFFGSC